VLAVLVVLALRHPGLIVNALLTSSAILMISTDSAGVNVIKGFFSKALMMHQNKLERFVQVASLFTLV
jgi:hypothetical protein